MSPPRLSSDVYRTEFQWRKRHGHSKQDCLECTQICICVLYSNQYFTFFQDLHLARNVPKNIEVILVSLKIPKEICFVWQQLAPGEEEGVCDRASRIVSRAWRFAVRAPNIHPRAPRAPLWTLKYVTFWTFFQKMCPLFSKESMVSLPQPSFADREISIFWVGGNSDWIGEWLLQWKHFLMRCPHVFFIDSESLL